jgi:ESS family glutamate:Na+ symporter
VPLAFNEGPGQALSLGRAWEAYGFADAANIGLTSAAIVFSLHFWWAYRLPISG